MTLKRKATITTLIILVSSLFLATDFTRYSAAEDLNSESTFLIYQLQTASPTSASNELITVINASTKPLRLHGLCVDYSTGSNISASWVERSCIVDPDPYTQLWVVSGGSVFFATNTYVDSSENQGFVRDAPLSSSMSGDRGAIRVRIGDDIFDTLGWGTSLYFEGAVATAPSNNELSQRKVINNTVVDNDYNYEDFEFYTQSFDAQSGVFEVSIPHDLCSNIAGIQETVPIGFEIVENECHEDLCLNIEGVQISLPAGMVFNNVTMMCEALELEDNNLIITELLPNVSGADDGKEFIEIFNPNNTAVELNGYHIRRNQDVLFTFVDTLLQPFSYVTLGDNESGIVLPNTTGYELNLQAPSGRIVSTSSAYVNAPEDQSWILVDGVWQFSNQPTPGSKNMISTSGNIGGGSEGESLSPCPEGKFRNPLTNRCKNIEEDSTLTPCGSDEYRNPVTNRCNKLANSTSTLKPCSAGQVRNPETNRCRSVAASSSTLQECEEGKERNPETNRCRTVATLGSSTSGNIQALTAEIRDVPAPSTGINWTIIGLSILGSIVYIFYEWRVELSRFIASARAY